MFGGVDSCGRNGSVLKLLIFFAIAVATILFPHLFLFVRFRFLRLRSGWSYFFGRPKLRFLSPKVFFWLSLGYDSVHWLIALAAVLVDFITGKGQYSSFGLSFIGFFN